MFPLKGPVKITLKEIFKLESDSPSLDIEEKDSKQPKGNQKV